DTVSEALFALDWRPGRNLELALRQPDGTLIDQDSQPYTFADYSSGHLGWRIPNPQPGEWTMIVSLQPQEP
ncbi:MAG TPA: hypothetical protein PKE45_12575, partial [Caldilineaceae bacterium]|nr:hypothetical protein [Caldilineaceae bacterium]